VRPVLNNHMASDGDNPGLAWARRPPRLPRRRSLRLPDGYKTVVYLYDAPPAPGRLPVVYLHGIQSHPGWFSGSAADLAAGGHPVLQPLRRGSGTARFARGHAASAGQLLDDVAAACRLAAEIHDAPRVHLLGVSWGGKLAACYAASGRKDVSLASLTMVAPGIAPRLDVSPAVKLAIGLSLLIRPRRLFAIPLNEEALFTDNEEMREYLRSDQHRLRRATASFFYASRRLDGMLKRARPGCWRIPTTLVLAERDRIIDNEATLRLAAKLAGDLLRVHTLPGCHTLEFEPDRQPLFHALAEAVARGD